MRIVFAGTPAFSVAALDALHEAGHEIIAAFTQPDRPAGRGQKLTPSPVSQRAEQLGIPSYKPESFRKQPEAVEQLRALTPEAMVVVAYGLILPQAVLDTPTLGCFNIHASLLPRWRGAAPIQRAILAGDEETGTTIMRMEAGLDTGPMLLRETITIGSQTAGELHDVLAAQGARLIVQAMAQLSAGTLHETAQPEAGVTYASKLSKEEARLDFTLPAAELARRIQGYNPAPGAWAEIAGERIKLLHATALVAPANAPAGSVVQLDAEGLRIATGAGLLNITEAQRPGGRAQAISALYRHWPIAGKQFT